MASLHPACSAILYLSDRSPGFAPAPSDTSAEVPGLNEGMINPGNRYLG